MNRYSRITLRLAVVVIVTVLLQVLSPFVGIAGDAKNAMAYHSNAPVGSMFSAHVGVPGVYFAPSPPRLHSKLTVQVSGLWAGQGLRFVFARVPKSSAFGGPAGTFYANTRGILHFEYPAFRYKQELGRWRMTGYSSNGKIALTRTFRLIP